MSLLLPLAALVAAGAACRARCALGGAASGRLPLALALLPPLPSSAALRWRRRACAADAADSRSSALLSSQVVSSPPKNAKQA
jgi:hypothetical protein